VTCIETGSEHKTFDRIFSSEELDFDRKTILEWIFQKRGEVKDRELPDLSFLGLDCGNKLRKLSSNGSSE